MNRPRRTKSAQLELDDTCPPNTPTVHHNHLPDLPSQSPNTLRCVVLSDTHLEHEHVPVPHGDILLHLGDFTDKGSVTGIRSFTRWFSGHSHRHKIVIDGNHDRKLRQPDAISLREEFQDVAIVLRDEIVDLEGLRILGLTWDTCDKERCNDVVRKVESSTVPMVHLLLSHKPPNMCRMKGSEGLVTLASNLRTKVHLFGHTHWARGIIGFGRHDGVARINCSTLPAMMPVIVDLDVQTGDLDMVYLPSPGQESRYQKTSYRPRV